MVGIAETHCDILSASLVVELLEMVLTRWDLATLPRPRGELTISDGPPKLPDILRSLLRCVDSMLKFGLNRDRPIRNPIGRMKLTIYKW